MPATTLPQLAPEIQYVSDGQGNLQSVIVPIDLWRTIVPTELIPQSSDSVTPDSAKDPTASHRSLFGAFPALAAIEFGDDLEAAKQLWRDSIDKQIDTALENSVPRLTADLAITQSGLVPVVW